MALVGCLSADTEVRIFLSLGSRGWDVSEEDNLGSPSASTASSMQVSSSECDSSSGGVMMNFASLRK